MAKKRHHYLSKCYLQGFVKSIDDPVIWIYEKGNSNIVGSSPKNSGVQRHFYSYNTLDGKKDTDSYENFFSKIEDKIPPIFKRLHEQKDLSDEDKSWFTVFLAFFITRVPNYRKNIEDATASLIKNKIVPSLASRTKKSEVPVPEFILNGKYDITIKNPEYSLSMIGNHALEYARILHRMKWTFLGATHDYKFLTSDNPISIHNPRSNHDFFYGGGLLSRNIQVTFPISKEIAFLGTWENYKEGYIRANNASVKAIVKRTVLSASRFVYASNKSETLNKMVQKYSGIRPIIEVF
jgi:hypothetical protein